jgi:hypothetical protein
VGGIKTSAPINCPSLQSALPGANVPQADPVAATKGEISCALDENWVFERPPPRRLVGCNQKKNQVFEIGLLRVSEFYTSGPAMAPASHSVRRGAAVSAVLATAARQLGQPPPPVAAQFGKRVRRVDRGRTPSCLVIVCHADSEITGRLAG